jgi:hypothetical protein
MRFGGAGPAVGAAGVVGCHRRPLGGSEGEGACVRGSLTGRRAVPKFPTSFASPAGATSVCGFHSGSSESPVTAVTATHRTNPQGLLPARLRGTDRALLTPPTRKEQQQSTNTRAGATAPDEYGAREGEGASVRLAANAAVAHDADAARDGSRRHP